MSTTTTARMGPSPSHNWFLEKCQKTACWILFQVGLRSPGIMRRPKLSCGAPAAALQGVINVAGYAVGVCWSQTPLSGRCRVLGGERGRVLLRLLRLQRTISGLG